MSPSWLDLGMRLRLLVAGLRWRAGASSVMLAVATAAVLAGAFGPIFVHSADQSVLDGRLAAAAPGSDGVTISAAVASGHPRASVRSALGDLPRSPGGAAWFGAPITTQDVGFETMAGNQPYAGDLMARTAVCRHVAITAGACPQTSDGVLLSGRARASSGCQSGRRSTWSCPA